MLRLKQKNSEINMVVPNKTCCKAFLQLEAQILDKVTVIEHWFRSQWHRYTPPFYGSVDLRNAGFKLAPIDTNLFPGGFNNLSEEMMPLAVQAAMSLIEKHCPDARRLLLIPENHTRNTFYLKNIARLIKIFQQAGLEVRLGSLSPQITERTVVNLPGNEEIVLEPLLRMSNGQRLGVKDFDPCIILLNNDLSAGVPDILQNLNRQKLFPPLCAGWTTRRKSTHFDAYHDISLEFANLLEIDSWLIDAYFSNAENINFNDQTSTEYLVDKVDVLLKQIAEKYREFGVTQKPFVIVKADAGTYGMGVMTVRDASELKNLNRKQRNKMAVIKDGLAVSDVILQEGVYTCEQVEGGTAEPVIYMMERYVVGGFYRVHAERALDENLNAPGARFVPFELDRKQALPSRRDINKPASRWYIYGVIARLALLAAAVELERMEMAIQSVSATS